MSLLERSSHSYHPDHLGSTAMVTDEEGRITQNVAYIPFGEVFVEERDGNWNTPYLFNAKEMDSETGLYYYGARYLDPTAAMWMTVDPFLEKYPGMSPYNYCVGNPVNLIDINGDTCAVLTAPDGAKGAGHMAILIQGKNKKWYLYSKNGTDENHGISGTQRKKDNEETGDKADQNEVGPFSSVEEFLNSEYNPYIEDNHRNEYTEALIIPTTENEDQKAKEGAQEELGKKYNVLGSNCARTVQRALNKAGKYTGEDCSGYLLSPIPIIGPLIGPAVSKTPNLIYKRLKFVYGKNGVIKTKIHK